MNLEGKEYTTGLRDMTREAACMIAMARPHYLRDTLEGLESCSRKDEIDWYIFQDGIINEFSGRQVAREEDADTARKLINKADLPNKTIEVNKTNLGVPLQLDKVFRLFDEEYDLIHFFESDVVVSKHALSLHRRIIEKFPDSVPTLYHNRSVDDLDRIEDNLDIMLKSDRTSFHTFSMWEQTFRDIEDRWDDFVEFMYGTDYMLRDHESIKEKFGTRHSSNDSILTELLIDKGYYRIRPLVSRALYIGMEGIHSSTENYQEQFEGNIGQIDYEQDKDLSGFRLRPREEYQ